MYRPEDLGPPDNSSTSYQYSYERTFDGPPMPEPPEIISERLGNAANVERQRVQSQRVKTVH